MTNNWILGLPATDSAVCGDFDVLAEFGVLGVFGSDTDGEMGVGGSEVEPTPLDCLPFFAPPAGRAGAPAKPNQSPTA